jgi:exodeoxyribonuclease VIII
MAMKNMNANWPDVGIYHGLSTDLYFAPQTGPASEQIVSKSMLWKFSKNPRRYRDGPPQVVTEAMRFGSLVDCLALTPDRYQEAYRVKPETYLSPAGTKKDAEMVEKPWNANSNTCKQWLADMPAGMECISAYTFRCACKARDSLFSRKEFREIMNGAETQVAMRSDLTDAVHGHKGLTIKSKSLMDIVPARDGKWGNALVDLKMFAKLNSLHDVENEIYSRGYHGQAALYLDTWNSLTGEGRGEFYFVFVLPESPYEVGILQLSDEAILAGRKWYMDAVRQWGDVVKTGVWPSPWDGIHVANLPRWAARKDESN